VRSPERRSLTQTDLNSLKDIGEGSQAVIKKAHLPESKTPPEVVAIREPKVSERSIPREDAEKFLNRADSWREIDDCERSKPHRWGEYEHIVGVIDIGDNLPWLALEYMDGGDLRQLVNTHPDGLPIGQALWIGECVCKGLEIAHNVGQSHLDVKPENVLLKRTDGWPWPKLADWGFARMVAEDSSSMEGYTPEYAAPEQFDTGEFGDLDQLTDIYQTGALMYTLLTGEPPVTGGHTEILNQVTEGTIPAPSERRAELPPVVDAAVGVALERQKTERYNSITNFREALNAIRTNEKLPRVVASRLQK
jgi:serine/threonine protein kinase